MYGEELDLDSSDDDLEVREEIDEDLEEGILECDAFKQLPQDKQN